jgi:hypothetical protein
MHNDFCDWVTCSGPADWSPGRRPPERIVEEYLELDEGRESVWMRPAKQMMECRNSDGSSSTKLMFRFVPSDPGADEQGRFWLDGNMGRIGRSDNLYGWSAYASAMRGIRQLLQHGLNILASPTVSRLDLTRNYVFKSARDMADYLHWVSGFKMGRAQPMPYPTGVTWVTDLWSAKFYDKSADLRRHKKTELCERIEAEQGFILRFEVTLRRQKLMSMGIENVEDLRDMSITEILDDMTEIFKAGARPAVADLLRDVKPRVASALLAWRDGYDFEAAMRDGLMSKATYYRLRKDVKALGYDIAYPAVELRFPVSIREVQPQIAECPDWYQESPGLSLVRVGSRSGGR